MRLISLILIMFSMNVGAQAFDTMPGTFVRQGKIIWTCLPLPRVLVCAPVSVKMFCQMDRSDYDRGILSCARPMMAEDDSETG